VVGERSHAGELAEFGYRQELDRSSNKIKL
jgi:hypothetical protein